MSRFLLRSFFPLFLFCISIQVVRPESITYDEIRYSHVGRDPGYAVVVGCGKYVTEANVREMAFGTYVTEIYTTAFEQHTFLKTVTLPSKLKVIQASAFHGCSNLRSIVLPDKVVSIGSMAFRDCNRLTSVHLPLFLKQIGDHAFSNCGNLKTLIIRDSVYAFGKDAFKNISPKCVLTVPYGKRAAYIAKGWTTKIFKGGIVELPAPEGIQAVRVDKVDKGTYYDLEGREITNPEKGRIYIRAGRKVLVK